MTVPLRIQVVYPFDPSAEKIGGAESFLRTLFTRAPDDVETEIVGVTGDPLARPVGTWSVAETRGRGVRLFPVLEVRAPNVRRAIPLGFRFTAALPRYLSRIDTEGRVLQFHRIEPLLLYRGGAIPKVLVIHSHTADFAAGRTEVRWRRAPRLYFLLERLVIPTCRLVYLVRRDAAESYRMRFPSMARRIRFLPTWFDEEIFRPWDDDEREVSRLRVRERLGLPAAARAVAFVGRIEPAKSPGLLAETFAAIAAIEPSAVLAVAGEGSERPRLEDRLRRSGLAARARFLGVLPPADVADLLRAADVTLLTSESEGMPLCVLESLACGTPVVSTDVGEVGLAVAPGVSGALSASRSSVEIASLLRSVLEDPRITAHTCSASVEPFGARRVLAALLDDHRRILSEGGRP